MTLIVRLLESWVSQLPFAVITIKLEDSPPEDIRTILEGLCFPTGAISDETERTKFAVTIREKAIIIAIHYKRLQGEGKIFGRFPCDMSEDCNGILDGVLAALSVIEDATEIKKEVAETSRS